MNSIFTLQQKRKGKINNLYWIHVVVIRRSRLFYSSYRAYIGVDGDGDGDGNGDGDGDRYRYRYNITGGGVEI